MSVSNMNLIFTLKNDSNTCESEVARTLVAMKVLIPPFITAGPMSCRVAMARSDRVPMQKKKKKKKRKYTEQSDIISIEKGVLFKRLQDT